MEEFINYILADCKTLPDAIKVLVKEGLINPQFVKDAQIYSVFSGFNRLETRSGAVLSTAAKMDISKNTVWRSIKRIEEKKINPVVVP